MASKTRSADMKARATLPPRSGRPLFERVRQGGQVEELIAMAAAKARTRERGKKVRRGATLGVFALLGFLVWAIPYYRSTESIITGTARRQALVLLDGSQAELNANTELFSDFRYGRRTISLRKGEAFFSVTKDADHPFLVNTPAGTVRVMGTKFNVRLSGEGRAEVTLLEGGITFSAQNQAPTRLVPGQQLDSGSADVRTLSADDVRGILSWREGRLALKGLRLTDVLQRLADYHGRVITCDPSLAELQLGGAFPLDDFSAFVRGLEASLKVKVVPRGDGHYHVEPQ